MRNRIRGWLIKLANWIGTDDYYDFGEQIKSTVVFGEMLVASTDRSIYYYKNNKWAKLSPPKKDTNE